MPEKTIKKFVDKRTVQTNKKIKIAKPIKNIGRQNKQVD